MRHTVSLHHRDNSLGVIQWYPLGGARTYLSSWLLDQDVTLQQSLDMAQSSITNTLSLMHVAPLRARLSTINSQLLCCCLNSHCVVGQNG